MGQIAETISQAAQCGCRVLSHQKTVDNSFKLFSIEKRFHA